MKNFFWTVLLAAAFTVSCVNNQKSVTDTQSTYKTMKITRSSTTIQTSYTATLEGEQLVEIRPQVSGTITKININEGDKVRKGQVLFVIDQVPYNAAMEVAQANVNNAEAKLATAEMKYKSSMELYKKEVVSSYELQTSKNNLAEAKAALSLAKAQLTTAANNLSYTLVKSPVDGSAGMIPYKVGALVGSNISTPLVTVSDDSYMNAYFALSENTAIELIQQYGSQKEFIRNAPEVSLLIGNGKEYTEKGRIDAVSGIIDKNTGSVRMRARFRNPDRLLMSGGNASVVLPTHMDGCILIPQAATFEIQNRVYAFKVIDGKAVSTHIEVFRHNDGHNYIVESGLEQGDVIISEGAGLVREGTNVNIEQ